MRTTSSHPSLPLRVVVGPAGPLAEPPRRAGPGRRAAAALVPALALCGVAAACGDDDTDPGSTYSICEPLVLGSSRAPSEVQTVGIQGALDAWRAVGVQQLRHVPPSELAAQPPGTATVELRFESAAPPFFGLYDGDASVIYVNERIENADVLAVVIAHELGHSLGLLHVPASGRASVMNPGNIDVLPNDPDQRALQALWGTCAP